MLNRVKKYFRKPEHKVLALMYHRICKLETDPWQLAVSPDNFEDQVSVLKKKFNVISVDDLVCQLAKGKIERDSICLTFDDGYTDNYLNALPALEKYQCPATFFIPTHFTGKKQQFWWDELEALIIHTPALPSKLSIKINSDLPEFDLDGETHVNETWQKNVSWTWPNPAPTKRWTAYLKIWETLRPLPLNDIENVLEQLRQQTGSNYKTHAENLPMDKDQLDHLNAHPLFNLGIHTQTHPALASHTAAVQHAEINGCKEYLEHHYGKSRYAVAYPYGNYNADTIATATSLKIPAAFTTKYNLITGNSSPLTLGRFQVTNYGGAELETRINQLLGRN